MGTFDWLNAGISHGFFSTLVPGVGDTPHFANDINTAYHTPITALFTGTVVSERTGLPWGTEIFVKPDDPGIPEYYYYHLDTLSVVPGQKVTAGQQIGLSGGQNSGGSNPSSPDMSTGPHTHVGFFTQYINTPIGSRPFGPDITPYIKALMSGQPPPDTGGSTPQPSTGVTVAGFNLSGFAEKAGLFLVALLLVGFGAYLIFKKQIDSAVGTAVKTAAVAA
jgi:murein DD-endopeptidase MepM/ murein hydrolase activator NlpD